MSFSSFTIEGILADATNTPKLSTTPLTPPAMPYPALQVNGHITFQSLSLVDNSCTPEIFSTNVPFATYHSAISEQQALCDSVPGSSIEVRPA